MSDGKVKTFDGWVIGQCVITSPPTRHYNCFAWAAGDTCRWWQHLWHPVTYWPPGVAREPTILAYESAYATLGYTSGATAALERGSEKVAILAIDGTPMHATRQLADGNWTSKLGALEDVQHSLEQIESAEYGRVASILGRQRQ